MIHLSWKETATRVEDTSKLLALAEALINAESEQGVMVYFEFENPQTLKHFCKTLEVMKTVGDIDELEDQKVKLMQEIANIEEKKEAFLRNPLTQRRLARIEGARIEDEDRDNSPPFKVVEDRPVLRKTPYAFPRSITGPGLWANTSNIYLSNILARTRRGKSLASIV